MPPPTDPVLTQILDRMSRTQDSQAEMMRSLQAQQESLRREQERQATTQDLLLRLVLQQSNQLSVVMTHIGMPAPAPLPADLLASL